MPKLPCFKAYDIRGKVPGELNAEIAYKLGRAYAAELRPAGPVAVGRDVRLSSPGLAAALVRGLNEGGADTRDLGLCGTEMVYFAAARPGMGGGIMVTASHNPMEYNGMKLVRGGAVPVSGDSGLDVLERRVREGDLGTPAPRPGTNQPENVTAAYVQKLLSFVARSKLKPLRIVANAGNGCAGPILDALAEHLPFDFIRIHHTPDGNFPNGVPNPMLTETHPVTANAILEHHADFGIAWDGDFDRCFFFDEQGSFVEGYYIVGLLAERMLEKAPGAAIIHDPRLVWNTLEQVIVAGGRPVQSKTGHAFIKERMRAEDAVYGGEMSAHHYFRDFAYCDTGMVPWLLLAETISVTGQSLGQLVGGRMRRFPCSGEINSRVADAAAVIAKVRARYVPGAKLVEAVDGLSVEFLEWRFNLRSSQTEPILRLNVETNADPALLREKTAELLALIRG
ncbi:MAG: phosphomannomutase [Lentisphaeria bacterium]|jgi:phosphomannomutase/phosphomannomutase/phosphoglucomutase